MSETAARLSGAKRALLEERLRAAAGLAEPERIPRRADPGSAPLSFGQQRLWFLDRLEPGSAATIIDFALRLDFWVDAAVLEQTVNLLVTRHEALRMTFVADRGQPRAVIRPSVHVPLVLVDLSGLPAPERERRATELATEEARRPFDLETGPVVRTTLVRLGPVEAVLLLTLHHIAADGWSMRILLDELGTAYRARSSGADPGLPLPAIGYGDYAAWQRRRFGGAEVDEQVAYWRDHLAGLTELELPADHPRPPVQTFRGAHVAVAIPESVTAGLRALARESSATTYMSTLAAFTALLSRCCGTEDVPVATYVSGRTRMELERVVGFFMTTLVMRGDLSGRPTFREAIQRTREVALGAFAHQDVPFERLVEELAPARDLSRNPLVQVAFQLFTTPEVRRDEPAGAAGAAILEVERGAANFDLVLNLREEGRALAGDLEYSSDLFDPDTAERLARRFELLLERAVAEPDRPLAELDLLTPQERDAVLGRWNATGLPVDLRHDLVGRFAERAAATPAAPAFLTDGAQLTYAQLDERSSRLAHHLLALGVGRGDAVGVCLDRSFEHAAALLAVLKAGATYLPLDPSYPPNRLAFMVQDAGAQVVLRGETAVYGLPATPPARTPAAPEERATIIYTSGSEGRPKGAELSHRVVLNRLAWMWDAYPLGPGDVSAAKSPTSFIDSLWELLGPLLAGSPTVLLPGRVVRDPRALVDALAAHRVTRLWVVPSLLRQLLDTVADLGTRLPALTFWVTTGEPCPAELARRLAEQAPHAQLHNVYGTSEVWDAAWYDPRGRAVRGPSLPIGRPIANVRTYVVDRGLGLLPPGVVGELAVGGDAAREAGYLGRPELTARRFPADPHDPGGRLYLTGDLARWTADGMLELLGRIDNSVKVRGHRVDLGEPEHALRELPWVRDAVVAVRGERLVGYVTTGGEAPPLGDWRRALLERVPEWVVPSAFVVLDELPLTPSGKPDRHALPELEEAQPVAGGEPVAPRDSLEELIAGIWRELLGIEHVGVLDSFFELGGHSLLATQVIGRIGAALGTELPLRVLFETPTVAGLTDALRADPERGAQIDEIAELVVAVSRLSDDEVDALLREREADGA